MKSSVDLGLAISGATLLPGERRSLREIAAFCGCHHNNIFAIEARALRKIRHRLLFGEKRRLGEALLEILR